MLYRLARPALFRLDPERAHALAIASARTAAIALPRPAPNETSALTSEVAGLSFANPLGLAAGFDKSAVAPDALLALGFGCVEVGSITPRPQPGNARPRLFRLVDDAALINRMGFNNEGANTALARLQRRSKPRLQQGHRTGIVGVNIGANADSPDRIADYATMARMMTPVADYLAINVSSPNTSGLRALQEEAALAALVDAVIAARDETLVTGAAPPPVFLKVAPDLEPRQIDAIARIALERRLGALIIANTTISRPQLRSDHAGETGGLSGRPLAPLALARLRDFRQATGGGIPLIGVGGIASARDAFERIRAGASLIQLYTAMVYRGPGIARAITSGLAYLLKRDGFSSIAQAVGSE